MATVTLGTVWLNVAADPSDYISLPTMSSLSVTKSQPGEVRRMANGRLRLIRQAGQSRVASVSVRAATRSVIEWLEDHVGVVLCLRDDRGRKFYGVYLDVDTDEIATDIDAGDVSLSLSQVSFSEAV